MMIPIRIGNATTESRGAIANLSAGWGVWGDEMVQERTQPLEATAERECPYVHRAEGQCAAHLTMGGIGYAFDYCFDAFGECPVYAELNSNEQRRETATRGSGGGEGRFGAGAAAGDAENRGEEEIRLEVGPGVGAWKRLRSRFVELTVGRKRRDNAA